MSIAGIRSNRGDGYQTLIALQWALIVLSDPDFEWIEIDSVSWSVDDVVIGKRDGTIICCQCKKNQIDFKDWKISELADELTKAVDLLANHQLAQVRFYSRSSFGDLAKLREHCITQPNKESYHSSLSIAFKKIDANMATYLTHTPSISTYQFFCRTSFNTTSELDVMELEIRERLRHLTSHTNISFHVLWTCLDQLGARMGGETELSTSAHHRLTKQDLKNFLNQAGAMLAPIINLVEVRYSFASTSAIGRTWHRDISGERIPNLVKNELLAAIDAKERAILLTGPPGSGKTCVMLDIQEELEQRARIRSDQFSLFIQSREFADLTTINELHAKGLPEQWIEKVARMAEELHVVIVIDSLDVLSIAREHTVLDYFLAQIDRLLQIPNITIITACREFDHKYDHRIAERSWNRELRCLPLSWESEIVPLLQILQIDLHSIDSQTRELIKNPRELAMFVELAKRDGSFNVVTSQALAQRYLDTVVEGDRTLGKEAMQALEELATEMLKSRSLVIPHQRFNAPQTVLRTLFSKHVLHETQYGELTFGHQTLLDVLVISSSLRQGITLNGFIQSLPPVPFVRPSIRSYVAQLAVGDRTIFRRQLRAVLTGKAAFHIRRLVAESFAEQKPNDEDWPLLHDLYSQYREVFQVVYVHAKNNYWHYFWMTHFIPTLIENRDVDGILMHANLISQWKNEDTRGVLEYWGKVLTLNWVNSIQFLWQLARNLSEIKTEKLILLRPILEKLVQYPKQQHDFLGVTLARCVEAGVLDDALLWQYISGSITETNIVEYDLSDKLHCHPSKFEDDAGKNFLDKRLKDSAVLLDLVIQSIEQWSLLRISSHGMGKTGHAGFLDKTSYNKVHHHEYPHHRDNENILMDAIENAILHHAKMHSTWWQNNREHLSFSQDLALRYFAILGLTASPEANIDLIGRIFCDEKFLESELSFELSTLIKVAFVFLDSEVQDNAIKIILSTHAEYESDERYILWAERKRMGLIISIPCHLRSVETQAIFDMFEEKNGTFILEQEITPRGGIVLPPFSYKVFLNISNANILILLQHYQTENYSFDDLMVGGLDEVATQLHEASARSPSRFLAFLRTEREKIPKCFYRNIISGVANYLSYSHGNLRHDGTWVPVEESSTVVLVQEILDELEKHPEYLQLGYATSNLIQACANIVDNIEDATRLLSMAIGFIDLNEKSTLSGDRLNLLSIGLNMVSGQIVEALMIVATRFHEKGLNFPEILASTLQMLARYANAAHRALILRRLPVLQSRNSEFGWELFKLALQDDVAELWNIAEPCLYYSYHDHFDKVIPFLKHLRIQGKGKSLETWGRISALAALSEKIEFSVFLKDLVELDTGEAWRGAASVWKNPENFRRYLDQCVAGLVAGLNVNNIHSDVVTQEMRRLFEDSSELIYVPMELVAMFFSSLNRKNTNDNSYLFDIDKWLCATAQRAPLIALAASEAYMTYVQSSQTSIHDYGNNFAKLLTRLFANAEEREESDDGAMLRRVVSLQDKLLLQGLSSINDWLKAAERP